MKIKVYMATISSGRTQTIVGPHECRAPSSHANLEATDSYSVNDPTSIEHNCKRAIDVVRNFADKHDIRYKIYNVENDWPAFRAWFEGVKVLPTVFIGKKKIEGVPTFDELASCL